jgi:hypothetical protein
MENALDIEVWTGFERAERRRELGHSPLKFASACFGRSGTGCGAECNLMQPGAQGISRPERTGLPQEDQEGCLEGVMDVVGVGESGSADPHHHRAMPLNKDLEGKFRDLGSAADVAFQKLTVGQFPRHPQFEERVDLPERGSTSTAVHDVT